MQRGARPNRRIFVYALTKVPLATQSWRMTKSDSLPRAAPRMSGFVVSARTLIHLGAELISSDEVALNELVKNAFDADSPRVAIEFWLPVDHRAIEDATARVHAANDDDEDAEGLDDAIEWAVAHSHERGRPRLFNVAKLSKNP